MRLIDKENIRNIFPDETLHPYYIVTPPYTRFSAGIKVLHLLCHALNQKGQQAFVLIIPDMQTGVPVVHPDLLTPRLSRDIVDAHFAQKRTPIVVYPETITGNPLEAPVVTRYVLNIPGVLGGEKLYNDTEMIYSYSKGLVDEINYQSTLLYLPVTNTRIYNRNGEAVVRSGSCYYARKYKKLYPHRFKPPSEDSIEITWEQTPEELADIYRRVEKFYCYESTSAALDAALCGCPTVSLPNEILKFPIGADSLGMDGHAWGDTPDQFEQAKATISNILEQYHKSISEFWLQLDLFVAGTQARADQILYQTKLRVPFKSNNEIFQFFQSAVSVIRGFMWKRELGLLVSKAYRTLRHNGLKAVLSKLKSGTTG
jgi:hypothetical protein